jgi:hypothetical protein
MELLFLKNGWYLAIIAIFFLVIVVRRRTTRVKPTKRTLEPIFERLRQAPDQREGHPQRTTTGRWDWRNDASDTLILLSWDAKAEWMGVKVFAVEFTLQWPSGASSETIVAKIHHELGKSAWVKSDGRHKMYEDDYTKRSIDQTVWREILQLPDFLSSQPYWNADRLTLAKSA